MDRITIPGFKFDANYVASNLQSFPIAQALNRLSSYEDTGLTPDEIAALRAELDAAEHCLTNITESLFSDSGNLNKIKRNLEDYLIETGRNVNKEWRGPDAQKEGQNA